MNKKHLPMSPVPKKMSMRPAAQMMMMKNRRRRRKSSSPLSLRGPTSIRHASQHQQSERPWIEANARLLISLRSRNKGLSYFGYNLSRTLSHLDTLILPSRSPATDSRKKSKPAPEVLVTPGPLVKSGLNKKWAAGRSQSGHQRTTSVTSTISKSLSEDLC